MIELCLKFVQLQIIGSTLEAGPFLLNLLVITGFWDMLNEILA